MGTSARPQEPSRSYSTRSRGQPQRNVHVPSSRPQSDIQVPASRPQDARAGPISPTSPISPVSGSVSRRESAARRGSVPDRSPLQKLEVKLDDISKEERRARIQEAELIAQERAEAERAARRALGAISSQQRNVSGPERTGAAPIRTASTRRNVSMPSQGVPQSRDLDAGVVDLTPPWDPTQPASVQQSQLPQPQPRDRRYDSGVATSGSQRQKPRTSYFNGPENLTVDSKGPDPVGVSRGGSFRDRSGAPRVSMDDSAQRGHRRDRSNAAAGGAATAGLGLYGMNEVSNGQRQPSSGNVSRYDSKRLSKELPPTPKEPTSSRDSRGIMAAQRQMEQERVGQTQGKRAADKYQQPDPVPAEAVRNPPSVPKSEVLPPATTGQTGRDRVRFGNVKPEDIAEQSRGSHHHLSNVLHRHHEPERRYQAPKMLDEWKQGTTATLLADDMDLEAPEGSTEAQKQAWWEKSSSQRKRSGAYPETTHDGAYDEPAGPTSFNPPLYLHCGPLLRYTGMRRDRNRIGRDREIWRGSVMIVTVDAQSSYQSPPSLRLFKQPMDLLPPPPAELDVESGQQLDPEYVDPLAGQIKVSRSGKTLYVKAVEELEVETDLSMIEDDNGLFEESETTAYVNGTGATQVKSKRIRARDGERLGKVREAPAVRLHAERGVTFWRFNLEVELGSQQTRIAYRINRGPAIGFWVPGQGETMNMMFHSCNGFSQSVDPKQFCGPDPMWRDVLNNHQTRPFHVMIGGGDQIYNDAVMLKTKHFQHWTNSKNAIYKHSAPFSAEMQNELEDFYLNRYAMWFSQGLFGMAVSQIPMVNIWDDHDIIDGFGSYPHHFMSTPVFTGLGAVAFKYYMLFQHQSVVDETAKTEPSWLLGAMPGPYIKELSRSLFMFLGRNVAFLGLDCRTERQRDEILSEETYKIALRRCEQEIIKGETKHLIVLLGVPIAYPRLNFLENILTSRLMDPIKALGRTGMLGGFVNKFDGGVEILDDLDDHWTAKHHKAERNWFIEALQQLAANKSVRITILGGDVHLAAVGQFYSNKRLNIPKDRDYRYMPNIISSAIVNTPPPDMMADIINKRNKVHHLNADTDEDMIVMFTHDVDGKPRNNKHLLPRRNWCSLREYHPGTTPPASRSPSPSPSRGPKLTRTLSDYTPGNLVRRLSRSGPPPPAYYNNPAYASAEETGGRRRNSLSRLPRANSADAIPQQPPGSAYSGRNSMSGARRTSMSVDPSDPSNPPRPNPFHRRPTLTTSKSASKARDTGYVNLEHGLDVVLNVEVSQKDPAGITTPYRLLIPALDYRAEVEEDEGVSREKRKSKAGGLFGSLKLGGGRGKKDKGAGENGYSHDGSGSEDEDEEEEDGDYHVPPRSAGAGLGAGIAAGKAPAQHGMPYGGDAFAAPPLPPPPKHPASYRKSVGSPPSQAQVSRPQPPQPPQTQPQPHRRSMGGILNKERDSQFERDAHVHAHTPRASTSGHGNGQGAYTNHGGRSQYLGSGRYGDDEHDDEYDEYSDRTVTPPPLEGKKKARWKIWR